MPRPEDLLEPIRRIVSDVIDRPLAALSLDSSIESLGIDSIALTEMVALVEDRLGVDIPASAWFGVRTVRDFVGLVAASPDRTS